MTNVHHEVMPLVADAAEHLDEAERILAKVEVEDPDPSIEPLRERLRVLAAEVAGLRALN
jgi:hypothetical protein